MISDGFISEDINASNVDIDTYIWLFDATADGYEQKMDEAYEKKQIPFLDFCAMSAVCAILKHPKRKEAVEIARKALLDNGFKEPFLPEVEGQMLRAVFYDLTA